MCTHLPDSSAHRGVCGGKCAGIIAQELISVVQVLLWCVAAELVQSLSPKQTAITIISKYKTKTNEQNQEQHPVRPFDWDRVHA